MKQLRIGDITIDAVIEREGPWRRPQDFFPAYDEAVFQHHLLSMEPEVFDTALGLMVITYQTFVVRTPHHIILVDTCTGEDKGHPPSPDPRSAPGNGSAGSACWFRRRRIKTCGARPPPVCRPSRPAGTSRARGTG